MRSEESFIAEYAESHQNHTNQIIHMVCVPAIFIATLALFWYLPVGRFLPGVDATLAPYLNAATLGSLLMLGYYARISRHALLVGGAWTLVSLVLIAAAYAAGWPVFWIALATWIAAWAVQFYGHKVEGAKPSFADDLVFLLIGPLFVQQKLTRLATTGSIHPSHG